MSDKLKAMINSIINDDVDAANLSMHEYVTNTVKSKIQEDIAMSFDSPLAPNLPVSKLLGITQLIKKETGVNTFFDKNDLVDKKSNKTILANALAKFKVVGDIVDYVKSKFAKMTEEEMIEAKMPLGHTERSKAKKVDDEDQESYFGKKGELFDPANPRHQTEKARREKEKSAARALHKSYDAARYPIIDPEFGTKLYDPEFVAGVKQAAEISDREWNNMDELEQIKTQVAHMEPPPRKGESAKDMQARWDKRALALQSKIKRPMIMDKGRK